jgi:outer membrane autotransporter protein
VEAGHSFSLGAWRSELFGSLHRFTLEEEAFVERGAHGMNLAVDSRRSEAWSTELGLRMARSFGLLGGRLVPRLELAWLGDFDRSESLKARFEGVPGGSAEFDGSHGHRHGGRLRTALGYERTLSKRTAFGASLMLEAEERLGERDVEGSLQLQLRF